MVLDGVVGAAGEEARDGGPFVSVNGVRLYDHLVLRRSERTVLHLRTQLVAPPQTARLAGTPGNSGAYDGPVACPVLVHEFQQRRILLRTPRTLHAIVAAGHRRHRLSPVRENAREKTQRLVPVKYMFLCDLFSCLDHK